ncbi:hypothetical protein F5Y19DRAFT_470203 [Xylariaceae sp. FL1651]|nr:hypothetical protein F5Y19DRAFT_470203 [Xylariaceae sp. FL1651]
MPKPHVLIIGGGLGGLTLAQVLRKHGVTFEIFERDANERSRKQGWSLGLHEQVNSASIPRFYILDQLEEQTPDDLPPFQESVAALGPFLKTLPDQVGLYFDNDFGVDKRMGIEDDVDGRWTRVNRTKLRVWLATHINIQWSKTLIKIEQTSDEKVIATFADGTTASGDILVGADGSMSHVREYILSKPNSEILEALPISTIIGEVTLTGEALARQLEIAHSVALLGVMPQDHYSIMLQGLVNVHPDGESADYFWILSWHDPVAQHTGRSLINELDAAQRLDFARRYTAHMGPHLTTLIRHTAPEGLRLGAWVPRDGIIDSIPVGRATLLGDAAHPTSPFRGEGGVNAIRDALNLGQLLAGLNSADREPVLEAVKAYQDEMVPRGVSVVRGARELLSIVRDGYGEVRVGGRPVSRLPSEKIELGPEGARRTILE